MHNTCMVSQEHDLTVREAMKSFLEYLESLDRSPVTIETYRKNLGLFFRYLCRYYNGQVYVNEITSDDLERYLKDECSSEKHTSAYIYNIVTGFKRFMKFCYMKEYCTVNIAKQIKQVKRWVKERVYLTEPEVYKLFDAIEHSLIKVVTQTMYYAGLRIGECIRLTIEDVDFENNCIVVKKGNEDETRIIPINYKLRSALLAYAESRKTSEKSDCFFASKTGTLSADYCNAVIKEAAEKAGLNKVVTCHILRHSFCSNLFAKGADISSVQRLMGHKDIKTTEIYLHTNMEELKKAIDLIS